MRNRFILISSALLVAGTLARADTIYAINAGLSSIVKFDSQTGQSLGTFASGLYLPDSIAVDNSGNVYVATGGNDTIEKYSSSGTDLGVFASGFAVSTLTFGSDGNLYAASGYNGTVERFSPTGECLGILASGLGLAYPSSSSFDSSGTFYIANNATKSIIAVQSTGIASAFVTSSLMPIGLAFAANGNLFASYPFAGIIEEYSPAGVDLGVFASGLDDPWGLAFDSNGNLLAASYSENGGIYEFDSTGALINTLSGSGFFDPTYLAAQAVPEPSTWALLIAGSGMLILFRFGPLIVKVWSLIPRLCDLM